MDRRARSDTPARATSRSRTPMLGDGPIDLVYVPGFISHLDLFREIPPFATIVRRAEPIRPAASSSTSAARVCRPGTPASGASPSAWTTFVRSWTTAGWEHANVFAVSEGGPLALLFAATYPERVQRLVHQRDRSRACCPTRTPASPSSTWSASPRWVERNWGSGAILQRFIATPDEPRPAQALAARYERSATTPRLRRPTSCAATSRSTSVRSSTRSRSPTLVVHRTRRPHRPDGTRPRARGLAPQRHLCRAPRRLPPRVATRPEHTADRSRSQTFLTGEMDRVATERVLATVMFTDIVDSTTARGRPRRPALARDARPPRHRVAPRGRPLRRSHREADRRRAPGDVRRPRTRGGVRTRAARHARRARSRSEPGCTRARSSGGATTSAGIGVHIAARVAALAGPSEVLVSRTVRDLVVGSDLAFEDRGSARAEGHARGVAAVRRD